MAALILEIASGPRHEPQYHKITYFPFTVGRAYDNDLILSDETVSPHHLVIDQTEEEYVVRNVSSDNGTWSGLQQLGREPERLIAPKQFNLGRTQVKVLSTDMAVAPTKPFHHASKISLWASDLRVAIALLALYLVLSVYFALERQSIWFNWEEVLVNQLFEIALPLLVATALGFISRLLLHRWQFPLQLSIACIALIIFTFSEELFDNVNYWLTDNDTTAILSTLTLSLCFAVLLAWQLRSVSNLSRKRAAWTSIAIVVPVFLIWELQAVINQPDFLVRPPMHTLLEPGDYRIMPNLDSIETIKTTIQQELSEGIAKEMERNDFL